MAFLYPLFSGNFDVLNSVLVNKGAGDVSYIYILIGDPAKGFKRIHRRFHPRENEMFPEEG